MLPPPPTPYPAVESLQTNGTARRTVVVHTRRGRGNFVAPPNHVPFGWAGYPGTLVRCSFLLIYYSTPFLPSPPAPDRLCLVPARVTSRDTHTHTRRTQQARRLVSSLGAELEKRGCAGSGHSNAARASTRRSGHVMTNRRRRPPPPERIVQPYEAFQASKSKYLVEFTIACSAESLAPWQTQLSKGLHPCAAARDDIDLDIAG